MKTELYYFDGPIPSLYTTIRTAKMLPLTILFSYIINSILFPKKLFPKINWKINLLCSFMISIFVVSAIGVQNSVELWPSVVYGALVYLIVYNTVVVTLSMNKTAGLSKTKAFGVVLLAITFGAISSGILYTTGPPIA